MTYQQNISVIKSCPVLWSAFSINMDFPEPTVMSQKKLPKDVLDNETSASLMEAIGNRQDLDSFERIFDHFAPRIHSYMLKLGAAPVLADDLVQDVMLAIWRRASQFDASKASVSTWIFTIARNRRIDVIRKNNRPELDPNDPALIHSEEPSADNVLQLKQGKAIIGDALDNLPDNQSRILRLAYFEDMSHSDIARELSLPLGTVKSRVRLATDKLRAMLMELN